jgi:hypothetical protein
MNDLGLLAMSERLHSSGGRIEGASPLGGRLGLPALLVREAVQNSWDARDDSRRDNPVRFRIDGWDLDTDRLDDLRGLLPVNDLDGAGFGRRSDSDDGDGVLHPAAALRRASLRILVISDRNTVGLCGPDRSGLTWEPIRHGKPLARGQQRFSNFVRNMGRAAANIGGGDGGAYGLGKSALWMASECGTILIHSRTTDVHGEPVERFIGSVHGEFFDLGGYEFTGRHFIGCRSTEDDVIDPLTGAAAQAAAKRLPLPAYTDGGEQVDGTSIVVVAPRLFLPWEVEMNRLRDAVRWHVWPKRVDGVRGEGLGADMDIQLGWNNNPVDLPTPLEDPEIRPYARTLLDFARRRKDSEEYRDVVAHCIRPQRVLGETKFRSAGLRDNNVFHLTLGEAALAEAHPGGDPNGNEIDAEPAVPFAKPWGQIAMIRREPLLLVRYEPIGGPEETETEVGVFLSADDELVEAALTKAEPPAHDDWNPQLVTKDSPRDYRKTFVKRTLAGIKQARLALIDSIRPRHEIKDGEGEQAISKRISGDLFGGVGGMQRVRPNDEGGASGGSKPRAKLELLRTSETAGGVTVHELEVTLLGIGVDSKWVNLSARGAAHDSSGPMKVDDLTSFRWETPAGGLEDGPELHIGAVEGTRLTLLITIEGNLRFRPRVDVRVSGDVD